MAKDSLLMICGGGTRFAMYGGMMEALDDAGMSPRMLLASCGGAIMATVINSFDTNEERKEYVMSREFFNFVSSLKPTAQARLDRLPTYCLRKYFQRGSVSKLEPIFERYIVDMPSNLSEILPLLAQRSIRRLPGRSGGEAGSDSCSDSGAGISTIIMGCRALYSPDQVGENRLGRKLFERVLMTDAMTARNIEEMGLTAMGASFEGSAVADGYRIMTGITPLDSMRISISDMFYVAPVLRDGHYYLGGAVDLVPIELACSLSDHVINERKQDYSTIAQALMRTVFGYDAQERLRCYEERAVALKVDFSDNEKVLRGLYVGRRINRGRFSIELGNVLSYDRYRAQVEAQWHYGYSRTKQAL